MDRSRDGSSCPAALQVLLVRVILTPPRPLNSVTVSDCNPKGRLVLSRSTFCRIAVTVLAVAGVLLTSPDAGAAKPAGLKRFAVDFLTLKSGDRLRGALLGQDGQGVVSIAVQRAWLAERRPELLEKHVRGERIEAVRNATLLRDRIKSWIDQTDEPQLKIAFLETELDRAQTTLRKASDPDGLATQFVVLRFLRSEVAKSFVQPPQNRQIAVVAWSEKLENVERRETSDLLAELKDNGIDNPADEPVDLTSRVPPLAESDTEWAARRAIVDYHFGKKLDFQGMGGSLFRTGEGAPQVDLAQVLPQLLKSQLGSLNSIADILGEPGLGTPARQPAAKKDELRTAIEMAGREGVSSFRVTQLNLNPARRQATVTQQFLAKMPDGSWQAVWRKTVSEDASKPRPELQEQIANDPQVAQVLKIVQGLGGGQGNQLNLALQFGGATMEAQKTANRQFFEFRDQYLRRLDGPPIRLPTAARR